MMNRLEWELWPYLPLKRIVGGRREIAVLYATEPFQVAYGRNVNRLEGAKFVECNPVQLVRDGWRVD